MAEELSIGVHPGLADDRYFTAVGVDGLPLIHQSGIKKSLGGSMRKFQFGPGPKHRGLDLGKASHLRILEPARYETDVLRFEERDSSGEVLKTSRARKAWKEAVAANPSKLVLTWEEHDTIESIARSVLSSKTGNALFMPVDDGINELGFVWNDAETGIGCAGKADRLVTLKDGEEIVVDLKTSGRLPVDPSGFARYMVNWGCALQAAFYLDGLAAATGDPAKRAFVFAAVETDPPFDVAFYEIGEASIEHGRRQYREALRRIAECRKTDEWPSYPDRLVRIDLPAWELAKGEDDGSD